MKRKLLSLVAICAMTFGINAQITNYSVGQTVNDFTVTDVHGVTHTLSSITGSGQWVILDFFFVACGPCQATVPYFSELHEKYGCNAGDLFCISLDIGDNDAEVLGFENTYSTSTGFSPAPAVSGMPGGGDAVNADFGPSAYPTYCLIDPNMVIKHLDMWPINSMADFEAYFAPEGFNPSPMACAAGVEENEVNFNNFSLYPNPASTSTTIDIILNSNNDLVVDVYNMVGEVVTSSYYNGVEGTNSFVLNTSDLENGQYIVKLNIGNESLTQLSLNILR